MFKLKLLTFSLFATTLLNATNYYLSNSGNDNNSGTSSSSPWASISKLNTVTYLPGDTVFFEASDVFSGQINIANGGTSSQYVVFTSYGSGAKPIITGADTIITTWTNAGTVNGLTIYETPFNQTPKSFFVNNQEQTIARYPNVSYLTLDSAQTTYLKDASLSSIAPNIINDSKLCVHSEQWCWELTNVNSFSGTQIMLSPATIRKSKDKYSYFLYDNINHLDTVGEWKYDSGAIKYIALGNQNPNNLTCLASIDTNGLVISGNASYIEINNLAFEKQINAGVLISEINNRYIKVNNCYFRHQFNYGVNDKGRYNEIYNSYFREVNGLAIFVDGSALKSTIHHNTFRNIGPFRNYGVGQEINLSAIKISFRDSCYIHHNDIDSTGYCGISADGKYNTIERNIVKHAMLKNNDGAALKSFGTASQYNVFKNNFVSLSDGNTEGTYSADFVTPAIYFDFSTNNCTIHENTIYSHSKKGIFQNSANHHNTVTNNVVYRASIGIDLNGSPIISSPYMTNMTVKHNTFIALDNNSYIIRQLDHSGTNNIGIVDSNYYFQPFNANKYAFRPPSTYYSFSQWQAEGFDANTQENFITWTYPTRYDTLFINPTDNSASINLGANVYLDLDSNIVCGTLTLEPYTSKVLIYTTQTCTVGIKNSKYHTEFIAFPNPASDVLYLKNTTGISGIEIVDINGRLVEKLEYTLDTEINISSYKQGVYIIKAYDQNGGTKNLKFIKN
ncbi:MAG: T9SS type A sorting domain-containing protein [Bacteroidia bacterium]